MKALLINPFYVLPRTWVPWLPYEPIALEYLAAVAADGHQVRIFDCVGEYPLHYRALPNGQVRLGASAEQIRDVIASWHPDIVGITMPFPTQMPPACAVAGLAKEVDRNIITVIGGAYACAEPERLLQDNPSIDIVAIGEGELTFKELLDRKASGLDKIKGILYRKGDDIARNELRELIADVNEIPFPRRDLVPFHNYSSSIYTGNLSNRFKTLLTWLRYNLSNWDWEQFQARLRRKIASHKQASPIGYYPARRASILTSRGCPFNCSFCLPRKVYGGQYRMRSAQNILDELETLVKDFGVGAIFINDENFNISKQRLIEICEGIIDRGLKLTISSQMYLAPWLDFETISLMRKAGFNRLYFGIESASQEIREKVLNKKVNLDKVEEVAESCKKTGIVCGGFLMIGIPGETVETMENTIKFALNSGLAKVQVFSFQPVPGTKIYDDCVKNGWLVDGYEPSDAYDGVKSRSYVKTPDFSPEDVFDIAERGKKLLRKAGKLDQPIT